MSMHCQNEVINCSVQYKSIVYRFQYKVTIKIFKLVFHRLNWHILWYHVIIVSNTRNVRPVYITTIVACNCFWTEYIQAISANQNACTCFRTEQIQTTIAILHLFIVISVYHMLKSQHRHCLYIAKNGSTQ